MFASFIGGLFYWVITEETFPIMPGSGVRYADVTFTFGTPQPTHTNVYSNGRAFGVEIIWTFLLATVVLQTATTETQAGNSFFGLAIGLTVAAGAITVGRMSTLPFGHWLRCTDASFIYSNFWWRVQSCSWHWPSSRACYPHGRRKGLKILMDLLGGASHRR